MEEPTAFNRNAEPCGRITIYENLRRAQTESSKHEHSGGLRADEVQKQVTKSAIWFEERKPRQILRQRCPLSCPLRPCLPGCSCELALDSGGMLLTLMWQTRCDFSGS